MTTWAIGDVQGCDLELGQLLEFIHFKPDRDQLWFTGDLVNRGPGSLAALRRVHALKANVVVVLGNHDLHLLAVALTATRKTKKLDTLASILAAPDRNTLLDWLLQLPLAHHDAARGDLLVHAGLLPAWSVADTLTLAAEVTAELTRSPASLLSEMYGDQPDRWQAKLQGIDRWRVIINALTRMRLCSAQGRIDLKFKATPAEAPAGWLPWYQHPERATRHSARVIFGHWSALGLHQADGVLALDTGCVWGGSLTAADLEDPARPPVSIKAAN